MTGNSDGLGNEPSEVPVARTWVCFVGTTASPKVDNPSSSSCCSKIVGQSTSRATTMRFPVFGGSFASPSTFVLTGRIAALSTAELSGLMPFTCYRLNDPCSPGFDRQNDQYPIWSPRILYIYGPLSAPTQPQGHHP